MTETLFVRIDDRLIHGQVVEAWLPHLRAAAVLIVSDAVAADPVQEALMSLAVPPGVALHIAPAAEGAARAGALAARGPVLVLAPGPQEVLALLDGGLALRSVNVGGLHHSAGKIQVGKAIFLSEADKSALRAIAARGVVLEGRAVPSERASNVAAAL